MPEEGQAVLEHPEPVNGVMAGEIQDSQITDPVSLKDANRPDSTSLLPPVSVDLPVSQSALNGVAAPSEPPFLEHVQTASSENDVRNDAPEETYTHEFGSPPSGAPMEDPSGQGVLGGSHSIGSSSVSAAEHAETPPVPDAIVPTGSVATQEQDRVLAKTESAVSFETSGSATVSASIESAQDSRIFD